MKSPIINLRRRQLDKQLKGLIPFSKTSRPRYGWIREIRDALGMTAEQLAKRAGVSQPTIAKLERSEEAETISLKSLKKIAEAMDCRLVYAFVPQESLEATLTQQAEHQASKQIGRIEHTMRLEAQGRDAEEMERERKELAQEMIRTLSRDIWETEQ
jgi:predicted DNA-binding mobile mystery protein A